jgi:hypothetical protein
MTLHAQKMYVAYEVWSSDNFNPSNGKKDTGYEELI